MKDIDWNRYFTICAEYLGQGNASAELSDNWCSWTTFERLRTDSGYWTGGLPRMRDIESNFIKDGGVWGQPFKFSEIAHIFVPREFYWESNENGEFRSGHKIQNINELSKILNSAEVQHRLCSIALEIKLY